MRIYLKVLFGTRGFEHGYPIIHVFSRGSTKLQLPRGGDNLEPVAYMPCAAVSDTNVAYFDLVEYHSLQVNRTAIILLCTRSCCNQ